MPINFVDSGYCKILTYILLFVSCCIAVLNHISAFLPFFVFTNAVKRTNIDNTNVFYEISIKMRYFGVIQIKIFSFQEKKKAEMKCILFTI